MGDASSRSNDLAKPSNAGISNSRPAVGTMRPANAREAANTRNNFDADRPSSTMPRQLNHVIHLQQAITESSIDGASNESSSTQSLSLGRNASGEFKRDSDQKRNSNFQQPQQQPIPWTKETHRISMDHHMPAHSPRTYQPPQPTPTPAAPTKTSDHVSTDRPVSSRVVSPPSLLRSNTAPSNDSNVREPPVYQHPPAYSSPTKTNPGSLTSPTMVHSNTAGLDSAASLGISSTPVLNVRSSSFAIPRSQNDRERSPSRWTLQRNKARESSQSSLGSTGIVFNRMNSTQLSHHTIHYSGIRKITLGDVSIAPRRKSSMFQHQFRGLSVNTAGGHKYGDSGSVNTSVQQVPHVEIQPFPVALDPELTFSMIVSPSTLIFKDPYSESLFLSEFLDLRRPLWRMAGFIGVLSVIPLTIYSVYVSDGVGQGLPEGLIMSFGAILPFLVILLMSFLDGPFVERLADPIAALSILILSVVSISARHRVIEPFMSTYKPAVGIILVSLACSTFFKIRHLFIVPVLAIIVIVHIATILSIPNVDVGNAVISIMSVLVACLASSVHSRFTEYLYRAYFAKVQGLDGSAKRLMEQWRLEAVSKISKHQRGRTQTADGRAELETPLEKAGLVLRDLVLDPSLSFEHARSLDVVLALLASDSLMTPEIRHGANDTVDAEQQAWLYETLRNGSWSKNPTPTRRGTEVVVDVKEDDSNAVPNLPETVRVRPTPTAFLASTQAAASVAVGRRSRGSVPANHPGAKVMDTSDSKSRENSVENFSRSSELGTVQEGTAKQPSLNTTPDMSNRTPPTVPDENAVIISGTLAPVRSESVTENAPRAVSDQSSFDSESSLEDMRSNVALAALLDQVDHWNFELFSLKDLSRSKPLLALGSYLFKRADLFSRLNLNESRAMAFMSEVDKGYREDVPYHNASHAADVLHGVHWLKERCSGVVEPSSLELLALYTAALIHDFDVLENHHLASAFAKLYQPDLDFMTNLVPVDRRYVRNTIIELVLATDLGGQHYPILTTFKNKVGVSGSFDPKNSAEDRLLLFKMCIKCADVGNPTKSWHIYEQWTEKVLQEFFAQGDQEKAMGLPVSPYCDRDIVNIPACQIGFIEFICIPLYEAFDSFVPIPAVLENLTSNRSHWVKLRDEQRPKEEKSNSSPKDEPQQQVTVKKRGSILAPKSPSAQHQIHQQQHPPTQQQSNQQQHQIATPDKYIATKPADIGNKWDILRTSKSVLSLTIFNGRRPSAHPPTSVAGWASTDNKVHGRRASAAPLSAKSSPRSPALGGESVLLHHQQVSSPTLPTIDGILSTTHI
ncbi:hypothetical protein SmJEL517_g03294 [Synchytrium microbalum]|uniref:PDEase domain-containing protein n=1 Tax=Synchytrium microbalum TaxID=1806994 RepID=A0A507C2F0_9FUNG|nr:uncharacterized protein SmJEL517_g03294 [Synchytrium microbalum]TPX33902.1 hypothetical protein SmJEL517_g03294 [Synchytrium microbalum]